MFEVVGAANLPLRFERVESYPGTREACGGISDGLREVQRVQSKIPLRELPLPETGAKGINRVVAAGDVFNKVELRQELSAGHRCRGLGVAQVGACDCGLRALPQCLVDGLTKRQRILRPGGQSS